MRNIIISAFEVIGKNLILLVLVCFSLFLPYFEVDYVDRVIILDVGQGDSILIISSKGKKVLIDTGPGDYVVQRLGRYLRSNDMYLDFVILTHPHSDHTGGLQDILSRYSVGNILFYGDCRQYSKSDNWSLVSQGDSYNFETFTLSVVYPMKNSSLALCNDSEKYNSMSIVVRVDFKNITFLLMGDLDSISEQGLISKFSLEKKTVILKAGHHCSSTSSSEVFLKYVRPRMAICSVGAKNKFGHPSSDILNRFESLGIKYLLTSMEGDIVIDI